ncbi:phosphotransferase [Knoellia koreensis]|uniref:Phosphotransferase n=1 Tax=Knoellia koreensis TaxID=2730921 RepID=A0A849HE29_9MICO|nr:phosphotransferase [Knoellia sp. DB2414S]
MREPLEVLCHNDFAPYNLVYRDGLALGVIDFDFASPGSRLWDLAYLVYRLAPLTTDRADGFRDDERLARLDRVVAAYGGSYAREDVLAMVVARLEHLAEFSDEKAVELANPDLHGHAELYRADIGLVEALRDAATPGASPR